jgi:dTDP-4-amino-4,6-dideoxygalactose transaminase
MRNLAAMSVESRPIMAGNFVQQPAAQRHGFKVTGPLKNAEVVARRGLYVGIPSTLSSESLDAAQEALKTALLQYGV